MNGCVAPRPSRCSLGATGSGTIGADREPGDVQASAAIRSETPGFLAEVPGPSPIRLSRRTALTDDLSDEEAEIYQDLAGRAGVVARRLLAERGLIYLEDLDPEAARELLRAAWREAACERFAGLDISGLDAEIDAMVDSLVMVTSAPDGVRLH